MDARRGSAEGLDPCRLWQRNNVNVTALTQSEIRDIILGMEIQAPSVQRQQIARNRGSKPGNRTKLTAVTTRTTNIHGDEIITTTTSNYEMAQFASKTDWRQRALASGHLISMLNLISSSGSGQSMFIPRNIIDTLLMISDQRILVVGYLYASPDAANQIKCCVIPPQAGTNAVVNSSAYKSKLLDKMVLAATLYIGGEKPSADKTIWLSASPTPLLSSSSFEPCLTDACGFFMTGEGGSWNYSLRGTLPEDTISLHLEQPLSFYDPRHRPVHFMNILAAVHGYGVDVESY